MSASVQRGLTVATIADLWRYWTASVVATGGFPGVVSQLLKRLLVTDLEVRVGLLTGKSTLDRMAKL